MSHTFSYRDPATGAEYRIHHNGDYSGDARVVLDVSAAAGANTQPLTFWIPCQALIQFAGEAVKDKIVGLIEELEL